MPGTFGHMATRGRSITPSERSPSLPPQGEGPSYSPSRPTLPRQRSASPGLLSVIGLAQPSLQIFLREELHFLHPTAKDLPSEDPVVQGTVVLWLPKKRTLTGLTVRMQGRYDISWGDMRPFEAGTSLDREVTLLHPGEDVHLDKGEHRFEFEIIVPSSTPCYERCFYGRVRHTVVAKAKGLGPMGGDIASTEKTVFLVVNPGGAGESLPPPSLDHRVEGVLDDLGPYTMRLQSQHMMVSGLLLLRFNLLAPPANLVIFAIKLKVNQHFSLRSPKDPESVTYPATDTRTIFVLDGAHPPNMGNIVEREAGSPSTSQTPRSGPLKILKPEEEYKIHHITRMGNDAMVRPTTQEWSESFIRVKHDLAVEVTFRTLMPDEVKDGMKPRQQRDEKGKERMKDRKKLVVSKPFDIFSCCCFVDSLVLPAYSEHDPNRRPEEGEPAPPCLCGFKLKDVLGFHGGDLLREEGEPGLTYALIRKDDSSAPTSPLSPPVSPLSPSEYEERGRAGAPRRPFEFFRTESSERMATLSTSVAAMRVNSSSSLNSEVFRQG